MIYGLIILDFGNGEEVVCEVFNGLVSDLGIQDGGKTHAPRNLFMLKRVLIQMRLIRCSPLKSEVAVYFNGDTQFL